MKARWAAVLAVAALSTSFSGAARGGVFVAVTVEELARASSAVCVVTPLDAESRWENGRIVTLTRARVDRVIAGGAPAEIQVRTLGGVVDRVGQLVDGEARVATGHAALLFLAPSDAGEWRVVDHVQGAFDVDRGGKLHAQALEAALVARRVRVPRALSTGPSPSDFEGRSADDLAAVVTSAWQASHAR